MWFPWNGSKRWLLPHLMPLVQRWPGKGKFIEPFIGSGTMSQAVRHEHPNATQVLGDANPWLISTYEWQISGNPPPNPDNWHDIEYWRSLTDNDLPGLPPDQRAIRFAICLHTAWGHRWKTTSTGALTASTAPINPLWAKPEFLKNRLNTMFKQKWLRHDDNAHHRDWKQTVTHARPEDLVFLDPPYLNTQGYGNQAWTENDLHDLMNWITQTQTHIIISNLANIKDTVPPDFNYITLLSANASKTRQRRREIIAHNLGPDPFLTLLA